MRAYSWLLGPTGSCWGTHLGTWGPRGLSPACASGSKTIHSEKPGSSEERMKIKGHKERAGTTIWQRLGWHFKEEH